ncbi:unnamed protein product [Parnassius mnemosyne]|uniref:Methyl-CpG-binding domain protein 5 n=1 Tax=Parnassius mnemosyne TaxID=213953 RepID=A0AAV1LXY4_9NEOP
MSGKPASVAASRAGVASVAGVAGAPRVLLYVAERQLEPAAAGPDQPPAAAPFDALYVHENIPHQVPLPRNTLYRTQPEQNDQRNSSGNMFYKHLNDNEGKLSAYEATENIVTHRSDFFPVSQQFLKEPPLKVEDSKNIDRPNNINIKRDCTNYLSTEYSSVETFQARVPVETGETTTYQRCPVSSDNMPSMVPVGLRHTHNQFNESSAVQGESEGTNSSEREVSMNKGYVNYQFLEQSATHQSIVNQSINILNQQVGVNRTIGSEGDSGSAPQLVRTADGVVLAVLPSPALPHSTETSELRTAQSEFPQTITVPLGWRRIVTGTSVLYISPSGTALSNLPQLREYLQTTGTCKCGLPCPLRPETAFSFDPKVVSKQYQVASGPELTKLCNHKRKLLATLQARTQSPATPPPLNLEQKKGIIYAAKKKMKKRPGFISNINVSPLMVQKDKPLGDFKNQEIESKRTVSPGIMVQRPNMQSCPPGYLVQQNMLNMAQENEVKHETLIQRSSHYLTVNNGWITQQPENIDGQKQNQVAQNSVNTSLNVGLPVLGTNGQIIGVNTGYNKQANNQKNVIGLQSQHVMEQDRKEEKKDLHPNLQSVRQQSKEEESQIFCGLNQALTPEVMQKINEQQQIFIQQNQKQIEMAMKGFKTQLAENTNQNKPQTQFVPQAQLVIQNGAVVKTNSAKTPPWQVKRSESNTSITSPSPKPQKLENVEYDEQHTNPLEDSSNLFNSFSGHNNMNQAMCSRVPPLPQHYNMMGQQWPGVDLNKKKVKGNTKAPKKKFSPTENRTMTFGNNGMRYVQDTKGKICDDMTTNNVPSFMDDPNGYLAQQTVLLNNTISKQVGISSNYDGNQYENSNNSYSSHNQNEKSGKQINKSHDGINIFKNNMVPNSSPSPNNTPDSSLVPEKSIENPVSQCCKGCNIPYKGNCSDYAENQIRAKHMKHNLCSMELDGNLSTSSPKHVFDDNPVTSSTFIERNSMINENSGPIQAGVVSTSNVSPTETLQPPEPSPTLSNSSRSTDTPHSSGSNSQMQNNCTFPMPSPAYPGSCRDNSNSNPPTPGSNHAYPYNSPGPPNSQSILGTQMMHFISNHNVNKNLMEVDNISMVGVKPGLRNPQDIYRLEARKRFENIMPGYCPPPHLGGGPAHSLIQACYVQTFVTTMASGFSVTRDTVTSVLAGKANTATTSINASQANFVRPPPPPSVNLATTYAIPTNQPDPFINSVNLPTSYPLHIAGTTAQNMISKSPLEMVQNVISSLPSKSETNNTQSTTLTQIGRRAGPTTPGQILISSTGQIIVSNNHMPPPPPKTSTSNSPIQASNAITNVTTSVTQVLPAVGNVPPIVNQPTVVVNTLPTPFVIQPPIMAVDGQVMQQNTVLPQIVTGGIVSGQTSNESPRQIEMKNGQSFVQGVAMLSPESLKKRNKKKKVPAPNITNVLQITAPQQNPSNIMVHHSSPQHNSSPQFSPRGFQLSPTNNISPTPMLQALTIVPGKSGTPAHIVMNGQGNTNNFGSQQIIANTSPSQQINLLQPVNLINNTTSVMSNFPAFQQFIVPNLGGMVMTADGTAIIQDNSTGMPMQLQLQTVNGQNVLTPVQNTGVFAAGANSGVVIRAQNQQGKIIQSQHSPGAQFLSPNNQVMMNSPNFNGQLSPLLANLSPTNVTFNTSPHQVRTGNVQTQEFIQTNQMGQTLMVPLSPKQVSLTSATNNRSNSTFVQQNTTIVQQQTTLVSNSPNTQMSCPTNLHGGNSSRLSIDPNLLLTHKQVTNQKGRSFVQISAENNQIDEVKDDKQTPPVFAQLQSNENERKMENEGYAKFMNEFNPLIGQGTFNSHVRHSVSTQTLVNQQRGKSPNSQAVSGSSPPDTTTHSPLGALETASSPRVYGARCVSTQGNYADTTTKSPEPADVNSSAMVQCVSSSEQDMAESRERGWPTPRSDINSDNEIPNMMSNVPIMRPSRPMNPVETSEMHYNQSMGTPNLNNQHVMPMSSNYYERAQGYKRKHEFGDGSSYRTDKLMRTNYSMVHGLPKDSEYDGLEISSPDKSQRHFPTSGTSSDSASMQKVFDRHNLGSGDDSKSEDDSDEKGGEVSSEKPTRKFEVGDLIWGPVKGYNSWPGKLQARCEDGKWSVRWFGADKMAGCVEHSRLLTLSEGLEAHHAARTKHRKSRKLNSLLENAIQEAMAELDKKCDKNMERKTEGEDSDVGMSITETPKRSKKHDKLRNKEKHRKAPAKVDSSRLRSSR